MKILQAGIVDFAGIGVALKEAISQFTQHECRAIRERSNYLAYPSDIEAADDESWTRWVDWADVVQVHEYIPTWERVHRIDPKKPIVWMAHGSYFREYNRPRVEAILDAHKIPSVASTPDLARHRPDMEWLPLPIYQQRLVALRCANGSQVIVQTRTSPLKGSLDGLRGDVDIVTGVSHEEALKRKGKAWLVVDQIGEHALGLGVSGLEAMAMGIPVLSGAPDELLTYLSEVWGGLPFLPTTPESLPADVASFQIPSFWERWAERGKAHVLRHHDPTTVAAAAVRVCERAIG